MGAESCAKRKSTSPRLFAIPVFDRITGHCNRLPNSNGEYANANFSKVRLRAVTIKTQTVAKPSYGRVNLWLVGSPGSEPGLAQSHNLEVGDYVKR